MGWKGLERGKLDYILTDLLPVELSELFSFRSFYDFLMQKEQQKKIHTLTESLKLIQAKGSRTMFQGAWATMPLKYNILKGNDSFREMSIIQPLSALNLYLFIECYQKDILNFLECHHCFSIRYHKKNSDLYYKSRSKRAIQYFSLDIRRRLGQAVVQQTGNFFKIAMFESINSFTDSRLWRMANFEYSYYTHMDYKSCFDSIYSHAYKWIIERNVIDSKNAKNSNLFITIDRILQNINGRQSNGLIVGPEFSRMVAEILLQQVDCEVKLSLLEAGLEYGKNYRVFRYVDDIFAFADSQENISKIISSFQFVGSKYLLHLNDLKLAKGITPPLPKQWLERTRILTDKINEFFEKKSDYDAQVVEEKHFVKNEYFPIDRIKDEFITLMNDYQENRRTIVSYTLSALLNNISKVKDGYHLFENKKANKALLIIDFAFFMYAFSPTYDSTRKLISMIVYISSEVNFKIKNSMENEKLKNTIRRYSFIFQRGNLPDIIDWFPLFSEYGISLDNFTERALLNKAENEPNPITWANLLLYSKYYEPFYIEIKNKVETIIIKHISKMSDDEYMMQTEFWYVLIYHNCPLIDITIRKTIDNLITRLKTKAQNQITSGDSQCSAEATILLCDYLCQNTNGNKPLESFFDWNENRSISEQITYRTFQRTIFKKYRGNRYGLFASID